MNKILKYIVYLVIVFLAFSCENEMEVYDAPGKDRLNFVFEHEEDTLLSYTFIYCPQEQMTDTLWMELETSGYVTDYDRAISLVQLQSDSNMAIAGTHYVAFDEMTANNVYIVPANSNKVKIPLVVKKDDPELENKEFILRVGIQENDYFTAGFLNQRERVFKISNILSRPKNWTGYVTYYFAGKYGKVKHQFMIDTGLKAGIVIDEDFFYDLVGDPSNVDMGETDYWNGFFTHALQEENARRAGLGLDPLREAPEKGETVGRLVEFEQYDTSDF
ncbi:MAG: DUF4843 domain-containing protein [Odoribacter sp.]|mgnify:CR=1 FL=1|nr:DUF4843 domain-containing protein [Odoribacter sp.]